MTVYDYDVFFSHSSKNKGEVKLLCLHLVEHQFKVWLSYPEIEAADKWADELKLGLDNSAILLLYWTKDASESGWVENEILEATSQHKPVLPLLFDDTPLPFYLNNVQHLDFRSASNAPYQTLVSRLQVLLDTVNEQHLVQPSDIAWKAIRRVSPRSQFLAEQNYVDEKSSEFALNNLTNQLYIDTTHSHDKRFVTFVSVPFPSELSVDMEKLYDLVWSAPEKLGSRKIGDLREGRPELWIDTSDFKEVRETKHELILSDSQSKGYQQGKLHKYIRFTDAGGIEVALGGRPIIHPRALFNYSGILGCTWKFVNFATHIYSKLNYSGTFQFLVNMRETYTTILGNFSEDWLDPMASGSAREEFVRHNYGAEDKHLQFIFEVDSQAILARPDLTKDIVQKLSRDLARSYNFPKDTLFPTQLMANFPWQDRYFAHNVGV